MHARSSKSVRHPVEETLHSLPAILMRHKRARCTDDEDEYDADENKSPQVVSARSRGSSAALDVVMSDSSSSSSQLSVCEDEEIYTTSPPHTPAAVTSSCPTAGLVRQRRNNAAATTPRSRWRRRLYTSRRDSSGEERAGGERNPLRVPPLPYLPWTEADQLWTSMRRKDEIYVRCEDSMSNHPSLKPHMRSILIDWLIEVCEVHRLHRETFYLSVEFLDRYLSRTKNLPKSQLQLAGITCLMIAAKLEEIYPPKLSDFAYVTDGACTETDIIDKELVIMKVLHWDLAPATPQLWLATYLQLSATPVFSRDKPVSAEAFVTRRFSPLQFVQMCQLLDLCVMDPGWLRYKYGVLAAAVYYHFTGDRENTVLVSDYSWLELSGCVFWMTPFFDTIRHHTLSHVPYFDRTATADFHNIQVHSVSLNTLEEAQQKCVEHQTSMFNSPRMTSFDDVASERFLTPPYSGGRSAAASHRC